MTEDLDIVMLTRDLRLPDGRVHALNPLYTSAWYAALKTG